MNRERRALEKTYGNRCDIYGLKKESVGALTKNVKTKLYENIPCALSQKELKTTDQTASQNKVAYDAKLFISPDIDITPGCELEVARLGRRYLFESAGEPFIYETHQEVLLKMHKRA